MQSAHQRLLGLALIGGILPCCRAASTATPEQQGASQAAMTPTQVPASGDDGTSALVKVGVFAADEIARLEEQLRHMNCDTWLAVLQRDRAPYVLLLAPYGEAALEWAPTLCVDRYMAALPAVQGARFTPIIKWDRRRLPLENASGGEVTVTRGTSLRVGDLNPVIRVDKDALRTETRFVNEDGTVLLLGARWILGFDNVERHGLASGMARLRMVLEDIGHFPATQPDARLSNCLDLVDAIRARAEATAW